MENNKLDFSSQNFYVGIDVHKKSWSVGIICNNNLLKRFTMDPEPKILSEYMYRNYPGGNYFSVYEAGFDFTTIAGADCLKINIERFHRDHDLLKEVLRNIKDNLRDYGFESLVERLKSIPGISFVTAIALVTEIMDINRFQRLDELCAYVGQIDTIYLETISN